MPIRLPPSKPISEKWLSRRRVSLIAIALISALLLGRISTCSAPPPVTGSMSVLQLEAFSRLNNFRGAPLTPTGELMIKAQSWSAKMARDGRLSHSTLSDGIGPGWKTIGENVAAAPSLEAAQSALEQSTPHRANMLNPAFSEGGVGVVEANGTYWITQDFVGR
jgi:uncharacterized protein YkwD